MTGQGQPVEITEMPTDGELIGDRREARLLLIGLGFGLVGLIAWLVFFVSLFSMRRTSPGWNIWIPLGLTFVTVIPADILLVLFRRSRCRRLPNKFPTLRESLRHFSSRWSREHNRPGASVRQAIVVLRGTGGPTGRTARG
jgi:hypothetical protein